MVERMVRAVAVALVVGVPAAGPAGAQVGPDARPYIYGRPGPDRDDDAPPRRRPPPPSGDTYDWRPSRPPPDDVFDWSRPRWHHRDERRRPEDSVCVTARGTCLTPAAPPDAPCGCEIPGFGYARGRTGD